MKRSNRLLFSLAVIVVAAPVARAQRPVPVPNPVPPPAAEPIIPDSLAVEVDSTPQPGWLGSLLRKVARRGDAAADSAAAAELVADSAAGSVALAPKRISRSFNSRADRREYEAARAMAERSKGFRLVVDIQAHRIWALNGDDTLRTAPVATAKNTSLSYGGKTWRFETPRGVRTVLAKEKDPKWMPPEWHYAEVATENGLKLRHISRGQVVKVRDGTRVMVKGDEVGVIQPGETEFIPLVLDEHIVFDNTLFVPPVGTKHRSIEGELGHYRLKLGDGYQLHGTPFTKSIGTSATHGCVRMHDDDIEWMYQNVPVGTKVYLY